MTPRNPSRWLLFSLISLAIAVYAAPPVVKRAQCANTLNVALVCHDSRFTHASVNYLSCQSTSRALQSHYFNAALGQYTGGSLWTDAVRSLPMSSRSL